MKTFFNISIDGLGKNYTIRIQSTGLRKMKESATFGVYQPKEVIKVGNFFIYINLYLTYSIELGGTVTEVFKQRRYNMLGFNYELYTEREDGFLRNIKQSWAQIKITIEEVDIRPCTCTISTDNK